MEPKDAETLRLMGLKIKKSRTECGMTQQELAGGLITRNMLSRIECGKAAPSIQTLLHISRGLGKPPGYFLAGDEYGDAVLYEKSALSGRIRRLLSQGDYTKCLKILENLGNIPQSEHGVTAARSDCELCLIEAGCRLRAGEAAYNEGSAADARVHFEQAVDCLRIAGDGCGWIAQADVIASVARAYLFLIEHTKSLILSSENQAKSDFTGAILPGAAEWPLIYARVIEMAREAGLYSANINEGNNPANPGSDEPGAAGYIRAVLILSEPADNPYTAHIRAIIEMLSGNRSAAADILRSALAAEGRGSPGIPMRCGMLRDLEVCLAESGDYRGAYEVSARKNRYFRRMVF